MTYGNLIYEKADQVAVLRLNRPDVFNAADIGLFEDLIKALEACAVDDEVKVIIITGEGKAFCAGGDLAMFNDYPGSRRRHTAADKTVSLRHLGNSPYCQTRYRHDQRDGCRRRIQSCRRLRPEDLRFFREVQAGVSSGLAPDGAWTLLVPLLIGFGSLWSGLMDPVFDAKEALAMGLVNKVVEDSELQQTTRQIALQLARERQCLMPL